MRIPVFMLTAAVAALLALEGWTLAEIVNLKVEVAAIKVQLNVSNHQLAQTHE